LLPSTLIPWNSPFSAAAAKLVPALLAGNTGLVAFQV
jgi:acyl-CoA reductase-like NAD-dependent aldehyde dehydrogenase